LVALKALIPLTNELIEDAPSLQQYVLRKVPEKMDYKLSNAILNGTGVGQPLGVKNSPALVTIAAESGQSADTLLYANVTNMFSRMYSGSRRRAVWVINQDIEPQLDMMSFPQPAGSTSSFPAYLPPGGLSASPYGTLKGKPVVPSEATSALGDVGDILLVDFSKYLLVTKGAEPRVDMSMHFFFDYDMSALRVVFRVMGMPWWAAPITRANSANTLSCFVALAERS
jgi:HK97 family phage major capsid protein